MEAIQGGIEIRYKGVKDLVEVRFTKRPYDFTPGSTCRVFDRDDQNALLAYEGSFEEVKPEEVAPVVEAVPPDGEPEAAEALGDVGVADESVVVGPGRKRFPR